MSMRRFTLPTLAATGALAVVGLTAGAASAHVTVTPSTTAAGAYTVLTFAVPHGCEGSATTKVTIKMPEEIPSVTPTVNPGWTIEKVTEKLAQPGEDAHGNELTERVSQVVYTARKPLPDGYRDTMELSVQLPDAAGTTLDFPVVQSCVKGETGWVETPAAGQDPEELEHPAPAVAITEAEAEGHGGASTDAAASVERDSDDGGVDGDGGDEGLAIGGLVAGVLGLLAGGAALVRSGKSA